MLAIFRWGMRRALLALLVLAALPARGSEPIRIKVIPYREPQAIPVLPFVLTPPPLLEPANPKKRRRNSGRDRTWENDLDWLMEND